MWLFTNVFLFTSFSMSFRCFCTGSSKTWGGGSAQGPGSHESSSLGLPNDEVQALRDKLNAQQDARQSPDVIALQDVLNSYNMILPDDFQKALINWKRST